MGVDSDGVVRVYSGSWVLDYVPGARLADIRYLGHVIDCVQVREWDFCYGAADQPARVPTHAELVDMFASWLGEHSSEYALA